MSLVNHQITCPVCGKPFVDGQPTTLEPLIDPTVRYIVVHWGETTFTDLNRTEVEG